MPLESERGVNCIFKTKTKTSDSSPPPPSFSKYKGLQLPIFSTGDSISHQVEGMGAHSQHLGKLGISRHRWSQRIEKTRKLHQENGGNQRLVGLCGPRLCAFLSPPSVRCALSRGSECGSSSQLTTIFELKEKGCQPRRHRILRVQRGNDGGSLQTIRPIGTHRLVEIER